MSTLSLPNDAYCTHYTVIKNINIVFDQYFTVILGRLNEPGFNFARSRQQKAIIDCTINKQIAWPIVLLIIYMKTCNLQ